MLAPHLETPHAADDVANRIVAAVNEAFTLEGVAMRGSASVGVSLFPDDGEDPETLLARADAAMFEAKALGKGRFQFASGATRPLTPLRTALGNADNASSGWWSR